MIATEPYVNRVLSDGAELVLEWIWRHGFGGITVDDKIETWSV